jgi:hypothetical protein
MGASRWLPLAGTRSCLRTGNKAWFLDLENPFKKHVNKQKDKKWRTLESNTLAGEVCVEEQSWSERELTYAIPGGRLALRATTRMRASSTPGIWCASISGSVA